MEATSPLIVAHRGASHDAPENTLAAFRLAWQQGADAIEGDYHLTRDGHIVCLHDPDTKRTAGVSLKVAQSTLQELRRLEVGSWKGPQWKGEHIPLLQEVLAIVPPGKKVFLELKAGPEMLPALREAITHSGLAHTQVVLISFHPQVIAKARNALPELQALVLMDHKKGERPGEWTPSLPEILQKLDEMDANGLDVAAHERVNRTFVEAIRRTGRSLHVWTIDKPAVASRYWKLKVASITTNRPQWLREQIQRLLAAEKRPHFK